MTAILGAVRGVDLVIEGGGGILKDDVLVDATSLDVALVAQLSTAKPRGSAPVAGSDVEVVAVANDPNRYRFSQRAVASDGRDLQFLCPSDLVELVACPRRHRRVTLCNKQGFACDWSFYRSLLCHSPARRCGRERTAVYLGLARLNPPAAADYRVLTELERWVLRFPPLAKGLAPT